MREATTKRKCAAYRSLAGLPEVAVADERQQAPAKYDEYAAEEGEQRGDKEHVPVALARTAQIKTRVVQMHLRLPHLTNILFAFYFKYF